MPRTGIRIGEKSGMYDVTIDNVLSGDSMIRPRKSIERTIGRAMGNINCCASDSCSTTEPIVAKRLA